MKLLWLQAAGCGGCTQSLLGAENRAACWRSSPTAASIFVLHPGLSEASGDEALALLQAAAAAACRSTSSASKARCCADRTAAGASRCSPAAAGR
jgi:hypothetical protein